MADGYSAALAKQVVGISQRCLDYWSERDIVLPSIQKADGKGSERRYSFDDLVKLTLVKRWRDAGLSLQKIRRGLKLLRRISKKEDPLLEELLITDGERFFFRKRDDQFVDLLAGGQLVFSAIAVGEIRTSIEEKVHTIVPSDVGMRGVRRLEASQ